MSVDLTKQLEIPVTLGKHSFVFVAVLTTASKSYDAFNTINVTEAYLQDREARLVLVEDRHLDFHLGRYGSDLNATQVITLLDADIYENIIIKKLWEKLLSDSI